MKTKFILLGVLILLCSTIALSWTPQDNIDLRKVKHIINGSDVNATNFYQNGKAVLDSSGFSMSGNINMGEYDVYNASKVNATIGYFENITNLNYLSGNFTKKDRPDLTFSKEGLLYNIYNNKNEKIHSYSSAEEGIKQLFSLMLDNYSIYISEGTYETNNCTYTSLLVQATEDNLEIYGSGKNTIIWNNCRFENVTDDNAYLRFNMANNLYIHDLTIKGNQSDNELSNQANKSGVGLYLTTLNNALIERINFQDGLTAIVVKQVNNTIINNIDIKNNEHGFELISVKGININNINHYKHSRYGTEGYVQSGMKIYGSSKNINVNNYKISGAFRECFRLGVDSVVSNINFNNIVIDGYAGYLTRNRTGEGFNLLNTKNININNVIGYDGNTLIQFHGDTSLNQTNRDIIISNINSYNQSITFDFDSITGSSYIGNVIISDSIIKLPTGTDTSYGIFISNNNLSKISFNKLNIEPINISDATNSKAFHSTVSIDNIEILNSYFHGISGDFSMVSSKVFTGKIINCHFRDNDIRGSSNFAGSSYVFKEFSSNSYGTISNPSDYGDFLPRDNNALNKRQVIAWNQARDTISVSNGSIDSYLYRTNMDIIPTTNNTNSVGNSSHGMSEGWFNNLYISGISMASEFSGAQNWSDNKNYPSACSSGYAVTENGDSNICSDDWVNIDGDTITENSTFDYQNSNLTGVNELSSVLIDTTNLEVDNLESNLDGTGYNLTIHTLSVTDYGLVEDDIPILSSSWDNSMDADRLTGLDYLNNGITLQGENITDGTIAEARLPSSLYTISLNGSKVDTGTVEESYLPSNIYTIELNGSTIDTGTVDEDYIEDKFLKNYGDTSTGPINMSNNDITNIGQLKDSSTLEKISSGNLLSCWNFDNTSYVNSTLTLDSSVNSNDGAVTNAILTESGKYGQGYDFDGAYIETSNQLFSDTTNFTISCWGKINQENGNMVIYQERQDAAHSVSFYYKSADNVIQLFVGNGTDYDSTSYSWDATAHYGEWHHFVGTFNAGVVNLYLDGSNVVNDDTLTVDFADLIGSWGKDNLNSWNGTLDEIQIFSESLSADEVQALYAQGSYRQDAYLYRNSDSQTIYGDIDIAGNLNMSDNNISGVGNIELGGTMLNNLHNSAYLYAHSNDTIAINNISIWYNVTYNHNGLKSGITHNTVSNTDTFNITTDGIYQVAWNLAGQDTAANPTSHITTRLIKNGVEVMGSIWEKDSTKQNSELTIHHFALVNCSTNDILKIQLRGGATTISMIPVGTVGDHQDSAGIIINRVD